MPQALPQVMYGVSGLGQTISERIDLLIEKGRIRQIATAAAKPAGIPEVTIDQLERLFGPWYKKWWVWALAGGVVVVGGGAVYYFRRRRR